MKKVANKGVTGVAVQAPSGRRTQVRMLVVVALLFALGTAIGVLFHPKPLVQGDAEAAAIQEGVAAFETSIFDTALGKLEPIAEKGNAQAAYWLGQMYENGLGVKKDADAVISWYRKAAEGGWTDARFQLGKIYFKGTE